MPIELNKFLSSLSIFYQNVHGFHWNIQGPEFFMMHSEFGKLYEYLFSLRDQIAERILAIKATPLDSFSDYIKQSSIAEVTGIKDPKEAAKSIVESLSELTTIAKSIIQLAENESDYGTSNLFEQVVEDLEKQNWMYASYLK